jgi:hypothetical protein
MDFAITNLNTHHAASSESALEGMTCATTVPRLSTNLNTHHAASSESALEGMTCATTVPRLSCNSEIHDEGLCDAESGRILFS